MATRAELSSDAADPGLGSDAQLRRTRRVFFLRRLHSLTGVVPLGIFLIEHFWTNTQVLYGRAEFGRAVQTIQRLPFLAYIEVFGIVLPLLFHAVYGMAIAGRGTVNVGRYPWMRNWMYVLQRLTGAFAFAFIGLHLWQYRVQKLLGRMPWENFYSALERDLNRPGMFAFYAAGVTSVVFHFANGMWLFGNTWGITVSEKSQRRSAWLFTLFGLALWVVGMNILLHFAYRCGGMIPLPEQHVETLCGPR